MLSAFAAAVFITIRQRAVAPSAPVARALPDTLGQWQKVRDTTFKDSVIQILGTNDAINRQYADANGRMVTLVMVSAVNNRSAFHPPEYCLTGGGSSIIDKTVQPVSISAGAVSLLSVNEMRLTQGRGEFLVWNWYGSANRMTANFYLQQWYLLGEQLMKGRAEGIVVNLYCDIAQGNIRQAREACRDFATALLPNIAEKNSLGPMRNSPNPS